MSAPNNYKLEDDDDDELVPPVILEQGYHNYIVIDNLPVESGNRHELFLKLLTKMITSIGPFNKIEMPIDTTTNKSKGYITRPFAKALHPPV